MAWTSMPLGSCSPAAGELPGAPGARPLQGHGDLPGHPTQPGTRGGGPTARPGPSKEIMIYIVYGLYIVMYTY